MSKLDKIMGAPEILEHDIQETQAEPVSKNQAEKIKIIGTTEDPNFAGSTIIKAEDAEGKIIGYAIKQSAGGGFEGNKITYQPDGSMGTVYQLNSADFAELEQQGVLNSYKGTLIDNAKKAMLEIYNQGEKINPWQGRYPEDNLMNPAQAALEKLSPADQEEMATDFFDDTIGSDISNNKHAYVVYGVFANTPFGQKFKQLEDERLKKAGFDGGFTL